MLSSALFVLALTTGAQASADPPGDKSIGQGASATTQISVSVFNTTIQGIIDGIQSAVPTGQTGQPGQFAAEDPDDLGFAALSYTGKGRSRVSSNPFHKAPTKPAAGSAVRYSVWGQTYVDREWRDASAGGIDFGRQTTSVGGLAGLDAIITNVRVPNDALVLGVLGSTLSSDVSANDGSKTRVRGPGVGVYAAYVAGGFSIDGLYKADFLDLTRTAAAVANLDLGLTNHVVAVNMSRKFAVQNAWWVQPTVGFSRTRQIWDGGSAALGYRDGTEWRVQGGVRTGTSMRWNNLRVEPTMSAMMYSPVSIEGGTVPVAAGQPAAPNDEGKLFGQFTGKLNVHWSQVLSSYVEGDVRGTSGVLGAAGRLGVRYTLK